MAKKKFPYVFIVPMIILKQCNPTKKPPYLEEETNEDDDATNCGDFDTQQYDAFRSRVFDELKRTGASFTLASLKEKESVCLAEYDASGILLSCKDGEEMWIKRNVVGFRGVRS